MFIKSIKTSALLFISLTLLLGVVYPAIVTGLANGIFPNQAQGSLIEKDGKVVGSKLIGQNFSDPKYFWGRLSATAPVPYNAAASTGSNYGVNNASLHDAVKARVAALQKADPDDNKAPIPVDLVTASGSGLDPHISLAAANYQISRVAKARGLRYDDVQALVTNHSQGRYFGVLGEPAVNVLVLNLALDEYMKNNAHQGRP